MKSFFKRVSNFEQKIQKNILNNKQSECKSLAQKFGVPFDSNGYADAGCPGIMSPVGEQPKIDINWGNGSHIDDKTARFEQFYQALKIVDDFLGHRNTDTLKSSYLKLSVHGRVMLVNIAEKRDEAVKNSILDTIAPIAKDGLLLAAQPFEKGGKTIGEIMDFYITPKIQQNLDIKMTEIKQKKQGQFEEAKQEELSIYHKEILKELFDNGGTKNFESIDQVDKQIGCILDLSNLQDEFREELKCILGKGVKDNFEQI